MIKLRSLTAFEAGYVTTLESVAYLPLRCPKSRLYGRVSLHETICGGHTLRGTFYPIGSQPTTTLTLISSSTRFGAWVNLPVRLEL